MMPSPPIRHRSDTSPSRRILTGIAPLAPARQIGPHRQRHSGQQPPGPLVQPYKDTHALGQSHGRDRFASFSLSPTPRSIPHRARGTASAPPTAISCLGAFQTPAARARG
jgi:hypothetical protein